MGGGFRRDSLSILILVFCGRGVGQRLARTNGLLPADDVFDLLPTPAFETVGAAPAKQLVEQNAERIDVGSGSHLLAADLFGTGVFWRHQPLVRTGLYRPVHQLVVEQFGDSEIEQLHRAILSDQDVRWFDVAMDDQPLVRVLYG